ncbi:hypothetical protein [Algoriphagus sp. NBT04N3]|uniref:hypothetical protein n=1 Tax=Algoriphagus sp. NBT04N3 TaxID=2705473 RepID=UPI00210668F1|nr:hypothetical protein [Algoriphagus sp. NBT04N3]
MIITKSTGLQEPFNKGKLKQSLLRSGANAEQADEIVAKVTSAFWWMECLPGRFIRKRFNC